MNDNPLVSICCITYNHASYIRNCLDGFLMQKTNFPYEILINDDCSTDGTTDIIREYENEHPNILKPIYHDENQYQKGVRRILANFVYPKAKGKYIAICEGDDYWTDSYKLQKQVDFLEMHHGYSMVCSNSKVVTKDGEINSWIDGTGGSRTLPTEEIIMRGGEYIPTASIIYRNGLLDDYPDCCKKCHVGDYPLQIYLSLKGKIYYFEEKMVVYRLGIAESSWTTKMSKLPVDNLVIELQSEIDMLFGLDEYTNHIYTNLFHKKSASYIISWADKINKDKYKLVKGLKKQFPNMYKYLDKGAKIHYIFMKYHLYWLYKQYLYLRTKK
jgi:glycosyltransferase involved in cell wall biosynthesis